MNSGQYSSLNFCPTKLRPLLGLTLLLIEDSRFTCEAVRMMCQRSGARLRRADCLKSAERHLGVYRPSIVIIDIGLPDGSGLSFIRKLHHESPRIPTILGTSGDEIMHQSVLKAGADGFLTNQLRVWQDFNPHYCHNYLPISRSLDQERSLMRLLYQTPTLIVMTCDTLANYSNAHQFSHKIIFLVFWVAFVEAQGMLKLSLL